MTPASTALTTELRDKLRRHGLVVWLDTRGDYTPFIDTLTATDFPYPIVAFRGSYLETLLHLDEHATDLGARLLVHLPGHTDETVRETPLFEVYATGSRYERNLGTLVTRAAAGIATPEALARLIEAGDLTLEAADRWLADQQARRQEGLAGRLAHLNDMALFGELRGTSRTLFGAEISSDDLRALMDHVERRIGMPASWLCYVVMDPCTRGKPQAVAWAMASWAMAVEFVHDLRRAPVVEALQPIRKLPGPVVAACQQLAEGLRRQHADDYADMACDLAEQLADEQREGDPEQLGRIDTFRFETERILRAAVQALVAGDWRRAGKLSGARSRQGDGGSFWLARSPHLAWAWQIVAAAASLHEQVASCREALPDSTRSETLSSEVQRYVDHGAAVDTAHRRLEQQVATTLDPSLPEHAGLRIAVGEARKAWRRWADARARRFTDACREHGPLPPPELRQRGLFADIVAPLLADNGRCAVFLVDALRFELARELAERIDPSGRTVALHARLAELPTITAIGMNALAPVAVDGALRLACARGEAGASGMALQGLRSGEFTVRDPGTRGRAMAARVGDSAHAELQLDELMDLDAAQLKKRTRHARLVVVHTQEIDEAGEAGLGPETFPTWLRRLHAAWRQLQDQGIRRFVFTADHGFLLQDETVRTRRYGRRTDPRRRYVWSQQPRAEPGLLTVRPSELGYVDLDGCYLFPADTAEFDVGKKRRAGFVHGGNSPQERIIPVLVVRQKHAAGGDTQRYTLELGKGDALLGAQTLRIRASVARGSSLDFTAATELEVVVVAAGRADVDVALRDARGARLQDGRLFVPVDESWSEVYLTLAGPADGRVQLEVRAALVDTAMICTTSVWFTVAGRARPLAVAESAPTANDDSPRPAVTEQGWAGAIDDESLRIVMMHLHRHGMVTEEELVRMLGSARAARRFSVRLDGLLDRVPFGVRVEQTAAGKRYVRQ